MITLNFISRIANDKSFFLDLVFLVAKLKEESHKVHLKIIGKVYNQEIVDVIVRTAYILKVSDQIEITRKSIPIHQLKNEESDFFLNISIGSFVGYSSIECLENNFKTIFYNVDYSVKRDNNKLSFCFNFEELMNLVKSISIDKNYYRDHLFTENLSTYETFILTSEQKDLLLSVLS